MATTSIERVAQGLGTLPEAEASCLPAFPMVCMLIAVSLGRLRPDLALARLGARVGEEEREEGWVAAGAEIRQIRKYSFGTPGGSGTVRVPRHVGGCTELEPPFTQT